MTSFSDDPLLLGAPIKICLRPFLRNDDELEVDYLPRNSCQSRWAKKPFIIFQRSDSICWTVKVFKTLIMLLRGRGERKKVALIFFLSFILLTTLISFRLMAQSIIDHLEIKLDLTVSQERQRYESVGRGWLHFKKGKFIF